MCQLKFILQNKPKQQHPHCHNVFVRLGFALFSFFFFFLCSDFFDLVLICQIHIFMRAFMNERQSCHMCFSEQMIKEAALGCLCGWKKDVKAACVGLFCFGQRMKLFTLKWTC